MRFFKEMSASSSRKHERPGLLGIAPTVLGHAFVIAQAAAVALFAELPFIDLRPPEVATA